MFKLDFFSTQRPSLYPIGKEGKGLLIFTPVRHTTAIVKEFDNEGNLIKEYKAVAVKHPFDNDNPALGKKYAIAKICNDIGVYTTNEKNENGDPILKVTEEGKEKRKQIWELFSKSSKAAAKIMGK